MIKEEETDSEYVLTECATACEKNNVSCPFNECKHWIKFQDDRNCDLISIHKNGEMTLRQVGERLGISYVRVKQIESSAIKKIKKLSPKQILED